MDKLSSVDKQKISILVFILLLIAILPSLFYVSLSLSSLGAGFLFSIVTSFLLLIFFSASLSFKFLNFSVMVFILLLLTSIVNFNSNFSKVFASSLTFLILMLAVNIFTTLIIKAKDVVIVYVFKKVFFILLFLGVVGVLFKLNYLGYQSFPKSIFTFYEPSHYAITVGPLYIVTMIMNKERNSIIVLLFLFVCIYSQNLTMILYWFIGTWFVVKSNNMKILFCILVFIALLSIYTISQDSLSYYIERLDFAGETKNLSTLVYLQGWSEMRNALIDSNGLGLGFQLSGTNPPSYIAEIIYSITGFYKNRQDSGFLAAKIIIEFGVLGIIFVAFYLKYFIWYCFNLKKINGTREKFFGAIMIAFSIEMFFRGQGYFTFGVFLLLTSICYHLIEGERKI